MRPGGCSSAMSSANRISFCTNPCFVMESSERQTITGSFRTLSRESADQVRSPHPRIGFTRFLLRLLGRGFVVLLLLLLFVLRHLLLLVLFLIFLATLVSHAYSFFSDCDLRSITARLIHSQSPRTNATTIAVRKESLQEHFEKRSTIAVEQLVDETDKA
jgi:hypothetical protein